MLVIILLVAAAFAVGVVAGFVAFERQLGVRRAWRRLGRAVKWPLVARVRQAKAWRRSFASRCDVCLTEGRCVDLTIPDGSGGVIACWDHKACSRRCAEQILTSQSSAPYVVHPDDIPF